MSWIWVIFAMTQVDGVCKHKKVPVVALVAMTLCWPLIFGPSYPLHLCRLEADPNASAMLLVYAGELAISCALVAAFWQRLLHAPRRPTLACAAAVEALAAWALYTADTQVSAFVFVLIAAMGALALASVVLFALWFATLRDVDAAGVAGWTAVSFVLFFAAELVGSWVRVLPASPTVLAPLGLLACAALVRLPGEVAAGMAPSPVRPGGAMASLMLMGCLCLAVGMVADALYGSGIPAALLGFEEFRMRRTVLRCVEVAVFAPVAVALVRGLRLPPVLACAGAVIVVLLVAELQSAPILLQMGWASADLPGVVITATCQAFLWLVAVCWFGGDQARALVPAYVAAAVALPKALLMVGGTATSGLVPGSSLSFVLAAVATWVVVALTCCLLAAFILRLRRRERLAVRVVPVTEMGCLAVEAAGECPVPEHVPAAPVCPAAEGRYGLSRREREVFELLGRGYTVRRIAETLYVSESTAQTHVRRIYAKVGVHSKQELIEELERRGGA